MSRDTLRETLGLERAVDFDTVGIAIAAPGTIRAWSRGEVKILKRSITERLNQKRVGFFASAFLVLQKIGSVLVESISALNIKVLYAIVVE